jgi:hypothetical protein
VLLTGTFAATAEGAMAEDCSQVSTLRASAPASARSVWLFNHTTDFVNVSYIDQQGVRQPVIQMPPGVTHLARVTATSLWQAATPAGACKAVYDVSIEPDAIDISDGFAHKQYFAEGATNAFFATQLSLGNMTGTAANALVRFQTSEGRTKSLFTVIGPRTRRTIPVNNLRGLGNANFSTVIESDVPLVADRTMSWDGGGYGSHSESAVAGASTTWYLAEGSTAGQFALFYLLQNPNPIAVTATIRYLRPGGAPPIEHVRTLPPSSRTTVPVDTQSADLAATDVSAVITSSQPIIVERAMYRDVPGQAFGAGHESAAVPAPGTDWFLAEGATGAFFDLFILLANPSADPADVEVTYLLTDGTTYAKRYPVAANSRSTIWVDDETLPGTAGKPLANAAVSSTIRSLNGTPIIVERAMWWPGPAVTANFWTEAHNSPGATRAGTVWGLADGEVGGARASQTYVLIANTSAFAGTARVTILFEDGTTAAKTVPLLARSRLNVDVASEFPAAANRRFASLVESLGATPAQLVVERAMYTSPGGVLWAAGTNVVGTPVDARTLGPAGTDICSEHADCPRYHLDMCTNNWDAPIYACEYVPLWRRRECVVVATCPGQP